MFAVVEIGGKQYRVTEQSEITIERLPNEVGDTVTFNQVLLIGENGGAKIGAPVIEGAAVTATVVAHDKAEKVTVFKKKRRNDYIRKRGHRQRFTVVKIDSITASREPVEEKREEAAKDEDNGS